VNGLAMGCSARLFSPLRPDSRKDAFGASDTRRPRCLSDLEIPFSNPALFSLFGRGDEFGRVAVATHLFDHFDGSAGDLLAQLDDFADRRTFAVAQIEKAVPARAHGENVRAGQINDVNVIADTRAVGRRVIRAKELAMRRLAERNPEHVGDQVRLDAMMLAEPFAGTGCVEVAKGDKLQAV